MFTTHDHFRAPAHISAMGGVLEVINNARCAFRAVCSARASIVSHYRSDAGKLENSGQLTSGPALPHCFAPAGKPSSCEHMLPNDTGYSLGQRPPGRYERCVQKGNNWAWVNVLSRRPTADVHLAGVPFFLLPLRASCRCVKENCWAQRQSASTMHQAQVSQTPRFRSRKGAALGWPVLERWGQGSNWRPFCQPYQAV